VCLRGRKMDEEDIPLSWKVSGWFFKIFIAIIVIILIVIIRNIF